MNNSIILMNKLEHQKKHFVLHSSYTFKSDENTSDDALSHRITIS